MHRVQRRDDKLGVARCISWANCRGDSKRSSTKRQPKGKGDKRLGEREVGLGVVHAGRQMSASPVFTVVGLEVREHKQ